MVNSISKIATSYIILLNLAAIIPSNLYLVFFASSFLRDLDFVQGNTLALRMR